MPYRNPFKPTAGKMPPVLVGREKVIDDFVEGLANGTGAPGRLMRITGPRGSGKTVLLSELAGIAREQGWRVVNVSGSDELLASLTRRLKKEVAFGEAELKVGVPLASVELNRKAATDEDLDSLLEDAVRTMTRQGKGLLVTIDEVRGASHDDICKIATTVQFMIRDELDIALVFAGITTGVMDILNGKAMTFLRRAKPEELDAIPLDEVAKALRKTIEDSGFTIEKEALEAAARATAGLAYLIQLVGYHIWRQAWLRIRNMDESTTITIALDDARLGIDEALHEFESAVLETALSGLPKTAVEILLAMSTRTDVVAVGDIARTLGRTTGYLSPYRRQLIARQIIEPTAPGYLTFSIPFMKDYLASHASEIRARYGE